jgi:tetratricopeptide (TPR) repeat protein
VAIRKATTVQAVNWSLQSASTYVREGNFAKADKAFLAAAEEARKNEFGNLEAEAYRMMAMYQSDSAKAIALLNQADAALEASHKIFWQLIRQERASILRTRIHRLVKDKDMAGAAQAFAKLQDLFTRSNDAAISQAYHSAAGVIGLAQGKYEQAIPHLEEDYRNPYSLQNLAIAYEMTGAKEEAKRTAQDLMSFNEPILEQALVVPAFRRDWPIGHADTAAKIASR